MSSIRFTKTFLLGLIYSTIFLATGITLQGKPLKSSKGEFVSTNSMQTETQFVVNALEKIHYSKESVDTLDSQQFLKAYIDDLDPSHMIMLQPQVNEFYELFSKTVVMYLKQGNLYPGFEIFKTYRDNARIRIKWILERLAQPFDFSTQNTFSPDRRKLAWPNDKRAADTLWENRLHYELINEILSESDDQKVSVHGPEFHEFLKKARVNVGNFYQRLLENINEIEYPEVQEIFLTSLTKMYDPHSIFFSADSLEDFSIALHNSMVGIGAMLSIDDGFCTIQELMPGGPAIKSGELHPKDKILAVGEATGEMTDIVGLKLRQSVKYIRGPKGTEVRLSIRPPDGDPSERKIVTLVRDEIKLFEKLAQAKLYTIPQNSNSYKIGVINIPSFYGGDNDDQSVTSHVKELLVKLHSMGAQGIVLDLRSNPGGLLLPETITLTGLFITVGPVVSVRDSQGNIKEYLDTDPQVAWDGPLLIMVSEQSASASEIFAGALKNYNRAIIVGDPKTHGKGTVQVLMEIDRPMVSNLWNKKQKLGAAKLTIQKWYLPDGTSTQLKGVPSDITILSINEFLQLSEGDLNNPMAWDSINSLPWSQEEPLRDYTDYVQHEDIAKLKRASEVRQNSLPEFSFLHENIERFRKKQEQKEFSLNLDSRKKQREADLNFQKSMEARIKTVADNKYSSETVLLNIAKPDAAEGCEGEKKTQLDIYEREGLRIMADYLSLKGLETSRP